MRYILTGVETNNKGAELMLYAILQQIESKDPQAEVFMRMQAVKQGFEYIKTSVKLKDKPYKNLVRIANRFHIPSIFYRLGLSTLQFTDARPVKNIDYVIDGSGFWFTDQWNLEDAEREMWVGMLDSYHRQGSKIIFLPQAFGPIELPNTKAIISAINTCADIIMPREKTSYNYMLNAGVNPTKMYLYPDFTCLVEGVVPEKYKHLAGGICIIPNMRMIDKGTIGINDYMNIMQLIITIAKQSGRPVYMLNHEGKSDVRLLHLTKECLGDAIEIVDGLNGLEVKGIISQAYLCISSRFHGVASALNSYVPCLATSWSHKYELLFKDYGQQNCVLNLNDLASIESKIEEFLIPEHNERVRQILRMQVPLMKQKSLEMWQLIWDYKK